MTVTVTMTLTVAPTPTLTLTPTLTDDAIQANIVAVGYQTLTKRT